MIFWSIRQFRLAYSDIEVVVTLSEQGLEIWNQLISEQYEFADVKTVVGGEERFHSIQNAVKVSSGDLIAVHDAARPFISVDLIQRVFEQAEVIGAVVPVVRVKDSLRRITFDDSEAVKRDDYRIVQTPQVFRSTVLKLAYEQSYRADFTDDASVVEAAGHEIALVDGEDENIKITTPTDLDWAKYLITTKK